MSSNMPSRDAIEHAIEHALEHVANMSSTKRCGKIKIGRAYGGYMSSSNNHKCYSNGVRCPRFHIASTSSADGGPFCQSFSFDNMSNQDKALCSELPFVLSSAHLHCRSHTRATWPTRTDESIRATLRGNRTGSNRTRGREESTGVMVTFGRN